MINETFNENAVRALFAWKDLNDAQDIKDGKAIKFESKLDYFEVLKEEKELNEMIESKKLFDGTCHSLFQSGRLVFKHFNFLMDTKGPFEVDRLLSQSIDVLAPCDCECCNAYLIEIVERMIESGIVKKVTYIDEDGEIVEYIIEDFESISGILANPDMNDDDRLWLSGQYI